MPLQTAAAISSVLLVRESANHKANALKSHARYIGYGQSDRVPTSPNVPYQQTR